MATKTKRYFTGTTLECAEQILNDGFLRTDPPGRVWSDHSGSYVYCIDPGLVRTELEYETGLRSHAFTLAAEQAAFTVYQFEHTRRVVFEVELERKLCEIDPDCECAIRYPANIPVSAIRNMFVEKQDHSNQFLETIGLCMLMKEGVDEIDDVREWRGYCERIKGLSQVNSIYWGDLWVRANELEDWKADRTFFQKVPLPIWNNHLAKLA